MNHFMSKKDRFSGCCLYLEMNVDFIEISETLLASLFKLTLRKFRNKINNFLKIILQAICSILFIIYC